MGVASAFRDVLDTGDAARYRLIWGDVYPSLPQLKDIDEARLSLHQARTSAESVRLEKRLYSHSWLRERGFQSGLPVELRPEGEQVEHRIISAIGVAVTSMSSSPTRRLEAKEIERIMANAGADLIRAGIFDKELTAKHMWQAREAYLTGRIRREI